MTARDLAARIRQWCSTDLEDDAYPLEFIGEEILPAVEALATAQVNHEDAADIYVPGAWVCPQCGFRLSQATIFAQSGEVGVTLDQVTRTAGECCPNDCTPMLRETWRERAESNRVWGESLMNEIIAATGAEHLPQAMERIKARTAIHYTPEQIASQRQHCADLQAFLRQKARGTANLRSATRYAEIAAVIDCYMEAIEASITPAPAEDAARRLADILHAFIGDGYIVPGDETKALIAQWRTPKEQA